jgi:hypothetical protein
MVPAFRYASGQLEPDQTVRGGDATDVDHSHKDREVTIRRTLRDPERVPRHGEDRRTELGSHLQDVNLATDVHDADLHHQGWSSLFDCQTTPDPK